MSKEVDSVRTIPYREYHPVDLDISGIDGLDIGCSDGRFQDAFRRVADNRGFKKPDPIVYPAPSKSITDGTLLPGAVLLVKKHGISRVNIKDHTFCAGFEEDYRGTEDEEQMVEIHKPKLKAAAFMLLRKMPEVVVVTYIVGVENVLYEREWNNECIQ